MNEIGNDTPGGRATRATGPVSARPVSRRRFLQLAGLTGAGAALAACSGSSGNSAGGGGGTGGGGTGTVTLPSFPLGEAAKASGTVEITMWHAMTNTNKDTLQALATRFNHSQSKIKVSLLGQTSYGDTFTAYRAGVGSSTVPDLIQIESIMLQDMIDSQSIVPMEAAIKADATFDRGDLLPSTVDFFTVNGVQYAMPWNCSSQVMFFNKTVFERAGLDPNKPPVTFAEYHDMAAQVKARGGVAYGAALKLSASNVEDWVAQAGSLFLNHDNGRTGRATAVAFGGPAGAQVFEFTESMLSSKIAEPILDTSYDNLFGIGNGTTAMGIDTSAALGTVLQVLRNGRYPSVVLGVGGLPGIDGPGVGVPYGGAGLYIVKGPSPERQDAAWQFVKYLLSPDAMATWAIGSGYIPITRSATTTDAIKKAWATTPQYRTAYEQVRASQATPATAGGVTGAFAQIETDLDSALSLVSNGTSGSQALAHAVSSANQAIASYNATV